MSHGGLAISRILGGLVRSSQQAQGRRNRRDKKRFSAIADLWTFTSHRRIGGVFNALCAFNESKAQEERLDNKYPGQHPKQENLGSEWPGFAHSKNTPWK